MFEFENVVLRKAGIDDVSSLYLLKQESWFGTHHVTVINMEDQNKWFASLDNHPHSPRSLVLIAKQKYGYDFGVIKLSMDWVNRVADVGWDIFQQQRGKGWCYGLARSAAWFCFDLLNVNRISCEILEGNAPSLKCASKAGLKEEGRKREAVWKPGGYVDSLVFGMLKSEWDSAKMSPSPSPTQG